MDAHLDRHVAVVFVLQSQRHMHKRPADEPAAQTLDLNGFLGTAYRRGTSSCQDTRLSGVHQPRRLTHLLVHH